MGPGCARAAPGPDARAGAFCCFSNATMPWRYDMLSCQHDAPEAEDGRQPACMLPCHPLSPVMHASAPSPVDFCTFISKTVLNARSA